MIRVESVSTDRRIHARHAFRDGGHGVVTAVHEPRSADESAIGRSARNARRPSASATERIRDRGPLVPRARRRRLRREVRLVAYAVMLVAPLAIAAVLLQGVPGRSVPARRLPGNRPPAVSLMIEAFPRAEPREPVILPGYVLPDDGYEESSHHAGG